MSSSVILYIPFQFLINLLQPRVIDYHLLLERRIRILVHRKNSQSEKKSVVNEPPYTADKIAFTGECCLIGWGNTLLQSEPRYNWKWHQAMTNRTENKVQSWSPTCLSNTALDELLSRIFKSMGFPITKRNRLSLICLLCRHFSSRRSFRLCKLSWRGIIGGWPKTSAREEFTP